MDGLLMIYIMVVIDLGVEEFSKLVCIYSYFAVRECFKLKVSESVESG
jgi:hypothetical protein